MARTAEPALTVFAWGNTCRGDDAIGPLLAGRLRAMHKPGLRVIEDHQLNIEHVTDIEGDGPVLFIDASLDVDAGLRLERVVPSEEGNFSTHAISPQALLNVFERTMRSPAPDAWVLHVAAREFGLGAEPGGIATAAVDETAGFLETVLAHPPQAWRGLLARMDSQGTARRAPATKGGRAAVAPR